MKVSEVIEKAMRKEILWVQAAQIIGWSPRTMHRWKKRFEDGGLGNLHDGREGKVPENRISDETLAKVLTLYRNEYAGFNVQHFWEQLAGHDIAVSYTWTKAVLHSAGLVRRGVKRKAYRRRREREPMPGMMLHLDGSKHRWFPSEDGAMQDLLALVDDATGEVLFPQFVPEEGTRSVLGVLREVVQEHGTFGRLYTDRASHFVHTPRAGEAPDRTKKSQVERVLDELGIELVCGFSPQARGRSERMWRTLQGRLPKELERLKITSYAAANAYLRGRFLRPFNKRFAVAPAIEDSSFLPIAGADLDRIFALRFQRVVGNDHTIRFHNRVFQLDRPKGMTPLQKRAVELRLTLDGRLNVYVGSRLIQTFAALDVDLDDPALEAAA
jgi:transposase